MLRDGVLEFCGIEKVETKYFGSLYKADESQRIKWIKEANRCGKKDSQAPVIE